MKRRKFRDRLVLKFANWIVEKFASDWYIERMNYINRLGEEQLRLLMTEENNLQHHRALYYQHMLERSKH